MAVAFVGGALAVFDSWVSAKKRPEQPTENDRRNW
jgi:hypothetical protein